MGGLPEIIIFAGVVYTAHSAYTILKKVESLEASVRQIQYKLQEMTAAHDDGSYIPD